MKRQPLILIVEDDHKSQKLLSDVLSQYDCITEVTASVEEAIGFLRNRRPDLMLLDFALADGDSFDVLRALREEESGWTCRARVPIVAMTAWAMSNDRERIKRASVDVCHAKPIDVREMLRTVQGLLQSNESPD